MNDRGFELTIDSDPFIDIYVFGRSDNSLETPFDKGGFDERQA